MTGSIESVSSSGDGVENSLSPPSATKKEVPDIENSHETSAGRERKPSRRLCKLYAGLTIVAITALVAVGIALAVAGTRAGRKDITKNAQEYRYAVEQVVGAQVLDDESSPYFQALTWITFNDPMGMSPADKNFLQRYIAACLYFATSREKPWSYCNPPQEGDDFTCHYTKFDPYHGNDLRYASIRWLTEHSECSWEGIGCDEESNMIEDIHFGMSVYWNACLDIMSIAETNTKVHLLANYNLTATFPEGIRHLSSLKSLDFGWNALHGSLPKDVVALEHLEELVLCNNSFTGTIPQEWYDAAPSWRSLDIRGNKIAGSISKDILNLKDLELLYFGENFITGTIPTEIGGLKMLKVLYLANNRLKGGIPSELGSKLDSLFLFNNDLSGTIPSELAKLTRLELVHINDNRRLAGEFPKEMWSTIYSLEATNCNFTGDLSEMFPLMNKSSFLLLQNNSFSGTIPEGSLPLIEQLLISGNNFTGAIPDSICAPLTDGVVTPKESTYSQVVADCSPPADGSATGPEIFCKQGCCTKCCDKDGGNCQTMV
jgi:hypothetical protein